MIQVIEENRKKNPSYLQSLMGGFAEGLPGAIKKYQGQKLAQQNMQQENEAAKRAGYDLSGFTDPKLRQQRQASALQGQREKSEYEREFQGKQQLQKEKFEQLGYGQGNQQQNQMNDPSLITDEQILQATAVDKAYGTQLRNLRNDAIAKKKAEETSEKTHAERVQEKNAVKELLRETGNYDEDELEHLSEFYDVPTARALNLQKKEPSLYEPTAQKLAAERSNKFINEGEERGRIADEKIRGVEEALTLHKQGATGFKLMNWLGDYFDNPALKDPASIGFNAAMKSQYSGISSIVGGKVSNFEFQTFQGRIASAEHSPKSAEILLISSKMESQIAQKERDIINQKREEYYEKGISPPANFDIEVMKELRPYADLIMHKTNEDILNVLNPTKKNNANRPKLEANFEGLL